MKNFDKEVAVDQVCQANQHINIFHIQQSSLYVPPSPFSVALIVLMWVAGTDLNLKVIYNHHD